MASKTSVSYDFKASFDELEKINSWFSSDDASADLSKAIEQYRRGAILVKEIRSNLSDVENEFKEIKEGLENG